MKLIQTSTLTLLVFANTSYAHTTYGGIARNLGPNVETFPGSGVLVPGAITGATLDTPYLKTLSNQTVTSDFGWVAGTSAAYGDAHDIRAFRFSLAEAGWATISAGADPTRGTAVGVALTPAFSLYSGLLSTGSADYDTAPITLAYLLTLGAPQPRNGAFNAVGDWKIGNDSSVADGNGNFDFSQLSSLTYIGHRVDGVSSAGGGDGVADGQVSGGFWLPAGNYTVIIGGANAGGVDTRTYGITASLAVVPEPTSAVMVLLTAGLAVVRRKRES